ncbi:MAG: hypothetical protein R3F34_20155, partial [Planctomycetota bacterium]
MADKLQQQLERFERTFDEYKKEFTRDGQISREEAVILKSVHTKLVALRKKVVERNEKNGIVDFTDDPLVVKVEQWPYDDSRFRSAFDTSIRVWTNTGDIALNRVHSYFVSTSSPDGISVSDVLDVVSLVFPLGKEASKAMGTIKTIISLVKAAYKATLPPTPSLNDIHRGWSEALRNWGSSNHDAEYAKFVAEFKSFSGIPADVDLVPVATFLPACTDFASR